MSSFHDLPAAIQFLIVIGILVLLVIAIRDMGRGEGNNREN